MEERKIVRLAQVIPIAFFVLLLLIGLCVYRDYGSFWDEGIERYSGIVSVNAIAHVLVPHFAEDYQAKRGITIQPISTYRDRYYGAVLQVPMAAWEVLSGFHQDKRQMWQTRHLFLFLFVYVSNICLFLLLKKTMGHWSFGLLGTALFWLSPRFFAESFYNVKDIGFLAAFFIGIFFLFRFVESPTLSRSIVFALVAAFAAAVRILGAVLPLLAVGFQVSKLVKHRIDVRQFIVRTLTIGISFLAFLVLFYPASWGNPFRFFFESAAFMSHHPWNGDVLFLGRVANAHHLPWYYLPVWILITTPLPILVLVFLGLIFGGIRSAKKGWGDLGTMGKSLWMVSALLFAGPLMLVVLIHPTLYDGWRHFYFLYAPMLTLAVTGVAECWLFLSRFWKAPPVARAVCLVLVFFLLFSPVCFWMIKSHPFQYVYFSSLVRPWAFRDFEKDYWGVSEIKGLEYIMRSDPRSTIKVLNEFPTIQISEMLPENDRLRIAWVERPEEADYSLTIFRATVGDIPPRNEVFFIEVDGNRILSVVKND